MNVLYISYDGLGDHIAQSQILPYVLGLQKRGWRFTIASHEKPGGDQSAIRRRLEQEGVHWIPLRYKTGSLARTVPHHVLGELAASVRAWTVGRSPRIVHARSYIPAAAGALRAAASRAKFIFDMRGFWIDEKIDTGRWQRGRLFRAGKRIEPHLFGRADGIVSLTSAGRTELRRWSTIKRTTPIEVIPTAVDTGRFAPRRSPTQPITIGYLGSLGERYLPRTMAAVFATIRAEEPEARLVVLTGSDVGKLAAALTDAKVPPHAWTHRRVPHDEVPRELERFSATLCLVKPSYATLATCPTKLGESLAAGRAVVVNEGIGDSPTLVREHEVGVVIDSDRTDFTEEVRELLRVIKDPATETRCMELARSHFELSLAIDRYERLYRGVLENRGGWVDS